ncbi:unnamed protein product [Heligmosomoides polygyrus]|uniref:Uncharacterized protein n=1 Tax=Heligmosomoides polygyrus TaxID=6339 RepID=A0A183FDJ4_HELPZ|nr:unnamed protein product [Heligmosomoides polygyrus]
MISPSRSSSLPAKRVRMESVSPTRQPRSSGTFDQVDKMVGQLPDYVRLFMREFVDAVMEMKRDMVEINRKCI